MFRLIFIFALVIPMCRAQCESGAADSCFVSVNEDLKFMLNSAQNRARNVSLLAVKELCLALDDSLNCTSDIIDTDCTFGEGRDLFDSWLKALRAVYRYLCEPDSKQLRDVLQSIQCWNVDRFFTCTKDAAGLGHVRDLLHIQLDDEECRELWRTFNKCYDVANVASCREQEDIKDEFNEMVNAFFTASYCPNPFTYKSIAFVPSLHKFSIWAAFIMAFLL